MNDIGHIAINTFNELIRLYAKGQEPPTLAIQYRDQLVEEIHNGSEPIETLAKYAKLASKPLYHISPHKSTSVDETQR